MGGRCHRARRGARGPGRRWGGDRGRARGRRCGMRCGGAGGVGRCLVAAHDGTTGEFLPAVLVVRRPAPGACRGRIRAELGVAVGTHRRRVRGRGGRRRRGGLGSRSRRGSRRRRGDGRGGRGEPRCEWGGPDRRPLRHPGAPHEGLGSDPAFGGGGEDGLDVPRAVLVEADEYPPRRRLLLCTACHTASCPR